MVQFLPQTQIRMPQNLQLTGIAGLGDADAFFSGGEQNQHTGTGPDSPWRGPETRPRTPIPAISGDRGSG